MSLPLVEPDLALLRAVLEHRNLSDTLGRPHVLLLAGPEVDRAQMLPELPVSLCTFSSSSVRMQNTSAAPRVPTRLSTS